MGRTEHTNSADRQPVVDSDPSDSRFPSYFELAVPIVGWAVGLLLMAWPTFSSAFTRVQGGLGDSRLVNFTLEHSYRWMMGMPLADVLWSPPIFFPVQGVATYTDLMLGLAPFYWPWRWLGCHPYTAYQMWMLVCWSLNFLSCYLLLRKGFRVSAFGATAGAYLFAFGSPRYMSMAHQQLVPQFWLVLSLAGVILLCRRSPRPSPARQWVASAAFWGGLVAQLYSAVYGLAFFVLGLAAAAAIALLAPTMRAGLVAAVKRHLTAFLVTGVIAVGLAAPLTLRYRATAEIIGMHGEESVHLPKPLSWVLPGNSNILYGGLQKSWDLAEYRGFSQTNGVGVVTLALCLTGLWLGRRRPEVQLIAAGLAGLIVMTMTLPGGWSPWWAVREIVPGSASLRAVARVGLMVLFPAAVGLAIATERLATRRRWIIAAALIAVVAAEQRHRRPSYDKAAAIDRVEQIAARVPMDAVSFLLVNDGPSWDKYLHDDAAWVALETARPTVNGRYGHFPPAYPFRIPWIRGPAGGVEIQDDLDAWVRSHDGEPLDVAMIEVAPRPQRKRRR